MSFHPDVQADTEKKSLKSSENNKHINKSCSSVDEASVGHFIEQLSSVWVAVGFIALNLQIWFLILTQLLFKRFPHYLDLKNKHSQTELCVSAFSFRMFHQLTNDHVIRSEAAGWWMNEPRGESVVVAYRKVYSMNDTKIYADIHILNIKRPGQNSLTTTCI